MSALANERGQSMLELMIVFPVIIGFVLATVVAAERLRFRLALHEAARHAARAAAVHAADERCAIAREAAVQSLAVWRVEGIEVVCGVKRAEYNSADLRAPADMRVPADLRTREPIPMTWVRIEATGRVRAAAEAAFPVMYAPQ